LKKQAEAKAKIKALNDNRVERQGQRPQPWIRPDLAQHQDMDTQAGQAFMPDLQGSRQVNPSQ
jgi:hypothetical protein